MKSVNDLIFDWESGVYMETRGNLLVQANKLIEELAELRVAICCSDLARIKDSIGDVYIALVSLRLTGGKGVAATRYLFDREFDGSSTVVEKLNVLNSDDRFFIFGILSEIELGIIHDVKRSRDVLPNSIYSLVEFLECIARKYAFSLEECVSYSVGVVRSRSYHWDGNELIRR